MQSMPLEPVHRGSTGPDVYWVQVMLKLANGTHGLELDGPVEVDGVYGPKTEAAVKAFQAWAKIGVDGVVGPVTRQRLIETGVVMPDEDNPYQK